ncbi:MAG: hypothetical protein ACXAC2_05240 [Candidatus Kariarchaeaceae archaeon]|jgi:hypothetical protein
MNKVFTRLGFLGVFVLLISSISAAHAAVDPTKIGVNVNDEFIFVVDKYTSFLGEDYSPGFFGEASVKVGGEFTMKILNATPTLDFFDEYVLEVEFDNGTATDENEVTIPSTAAGEDAIYGLIMFTDWNFWETELSAFPASGKEAGVVNSYKLDNGEEEFSVSWSVSVTDEGTDIKDDSQYIYEKSTGVLLYSKEKFEASTPGLTLKSDDIIRRKGFSAPSGDSDGGFLPGFDFVAAFAGVSLLIVIFRKKE